MGVRRGDRKKGTTGANVSKGEGEVDVNSDRYIDHHRNYTRKTVFEPKGT